MPGLLPRGHHVYPTWAQQTILSHSDHQTTQPPPMDDIGFWSHIIFLRLTFSGNEGKKREENSDDFNTNSN